VLTITTPAGPRAWSLAGLEHAWRCPA
jgi:hypothetical protein